MGAQSGYLTRGGEREKGSREGFLKEMTKEPSDRESGKAESDIWEKAFCFTKLWKAGHYLEHRMWRWNIQGSESFFSCLLFPKLVMWDILCEEGFVNLRCLEFTLEAQVGPIIDGQDWVCCYPWTHVFSVKSKIKQQTSWLFWISLYSKTEAGEAMTLKAQTFVLLTAMFL